MDWKAYWNDSPFLRHTDPCQQVGRTFHRHSYSAAQMSATVGRTLAFLEPGPEKTLLDLACGNGMLTSEVAEHFKQVTAIDFSAPLITSAREHFTRVNIDYIVGDVLDLDWPLGQYDRIMIQFAFQYFLPEQAERLFEGFARMLKRDGIILLGDVADGDRVRNFYRGVSGLARRYVDQLRDKPIIGHWWKTLDLTELAHRHNMTLRISYQDTDMPNHYFRYDAVLRKLS